MKSLFVSHSNLAVERERAIAYLNEIASLLNVQAPEVEVFKSNELIYAVASFKGQIVSVIAEPTMDDLLNELEELSRRIAFAYEEPELFPDFVPSETHDTVEALKARVMQ
ncbi:hypothetical protein PMO31116_00511 [Pandoraea morbifera]|uniref:Uncharacterized protein n=1 Tax=Pandoraea morbifera TaxID=2508300 RepID=A0A5E4S3A8_9BURK|nr:hypothetical protein [Pandoraea morbifera]VVD69202.1 hypothetical protein PMO31116_00511 [Pandoraea morbifera]